MNKKYLWINVLLMFITYGIWAIIYLYLKYKYSIELKNKNIRSFSLKVAGVTFTNDDGTDRYSKTPTTIPAHESIRVHAPCPAWVK